MCLAASCLALGACAGGARERTMEARSAVVAATPGSTDLSYFSVHDNLPRTSVAQPMSATAAVSGD